MAKRLRDTTPPVEAAAIELRQRATQAELPLWQLIRNRQLDGLKFRRQDPVSRYILDFYCAEARLAIEIDGEIHRDQGEMVNFRSDYLASVGIQVLRFSNSDILDRPNAVLREIRSACRLRVDPVNDPDD